MNFKVLLIFLLIISCSTPNDPDRSLVLNDTLIIYYQEILSNIDKNITVKFDSLYEARCPIDVVCHWPGEVKILFSLSSGDNKTDFWLVKPGLFSSQTEDTTVYGYSITLINVYPYPHTDSTYSSNDYSAEIVVSN